MEHDFKIIKINVEEKKVGLSLRAVNGQEASRAEVQDYKAEREPRGKGEPRSGGSHKAPVSSSTTTLGDLINWKSERENES
jgi:small subunit ribosomal protein S1